MGNVIDKVINKGPPFAPECIPKCTPGPNDLRGNICYKGKCVNLCPVDSIIGDDEKCICNEDNAVYKDDNTKNNNDPTNGDGWGYCFTKEFEEDEINKKLQEELSKNPNMTEEEEMLLKKKIIKDNENKNKERKKEKLRFNPTSLFIDRTPKELDERVKSIVKEELKKNPKMTDEELVKLISQTTVDVVEELATECEEEYKLVKTILSPKYGNGKWPNREKLKELIETKNFPWLISQVSQWPKEKSITSCQMITAVKDKITINNRCIYSDDYPNTIEECNVECGLGTEVKSKKIIRESNNDFPSLHPCSNDPPIKEFQCDSGIICKEDCKLEINLKSFGEAKCSKPCDSGDGPGKKTYKVKYVKASQGEDDNMGSCDLDEEGKEEGKEYNVTVDCNKEKCPDCEIESKGPYKDNLVDYTGSIVVDNKNKTFTKCLLPKKDGTFKSIDCGGAKGGFNYNKGARAKYNMTYKITKENGVQNCTKGEDVIEEGCPVNVFDPELNPIVGEDGKLLKGGGEECGNECILSDDFPQLVMVEGKECSKTCGGGLQRMRKVVKSKSDAPYCPCKNDPSKCPYEEIPCNTQECIAPCEYTNGKDTKHVQINDPCPGVKGINEHVVWDTEKKNSKGEKGMWYDSIKKKHYPRNHFVKKMRVPTKKPPIGKGLCYQGDKADKTLPCLTKGTEKPIDAEWGPWEFKDYVGEGSTIRKITPKYSNWTFPKINTVKVGATKVGFTVPGSGIIKWPNGGIDAAVQVVKDLGHTLGKTVHYIEKKGNTIFLYKKEGNTGTSGADTWEFQKGEEQNPNFGREGEHCIYEKDLLFATPEQLPGKRYIREVKTYSAYDGTEATLIDGGDNTKVVPYMRKDGINIIKGGKPLNNMSEVECKQWVKDTPESFEAKEGLGGTWRHIPQGCVVQDDGKTHYNRTASNKECSSGGYHCVEKGPGGAGYIKYCPIDASLNPEVPIDEIDITGSLGQQQKCYQPNNNEGRKKYTVKELEDEAKRRFVRDNQLPKYTAIDRNKEYRILGPGSRTIYRSKMRTEDSPEKYGGLPSGLWHEKKENFGDVYDRRINEYDNCERVGKIIQKIREGNELKKKNYGDWQSDPFVEQVNCVPVYEWDGKFYKDEKSAWAGSTSEEIMKPAQDRKATKVEPSKKDPGEYLHKTGKFLMSSVYDTGLWSTPSLDGTHGWLARRDRRTSPGWMRMETVSGDIELVKGVVTKGRDKTHHTTKFKVYVSRNGDSWKQMKDRNGNYEFSGGTDKNTNYLKTNYFKDGPVEARYIKFYPTAGGYWRSLNAGYVKDMSGVVKCKGDSGMLQDEPWFRFTFSEAKTKSKGTMSEGTAASTKQCPPDGHVLVAQKGNIVGGPNNIPVNNLKLFKVDGKVYGLKGTMSTESLPGCGVDANSPGWRSSASGGSFSWGACVQPNKKGLETGTPAYHTGHGGFRYMYRHWIGSNKNKALGEGNGYNRINNYIYFKDNTQSSNANNGLIYTLPSTSFKVQDYENVNVIRQPCNRGTKGVLPTLGTEWVSTIPAATGGTSGWKGHIWNYSGGTEGWLDQPGKFKWTDGFKNRIYELIKNKGIGTRKDVNEYLVEEKEGTNNNKRGTDSHSWSDGSKSYGGHINGGRAYHSIGYSSTNWRTGLRDTNSCAKYKQSTEFIPVGIKIQPRGGVLGQAPTEIRLVWNGGETTVTLGTFANANTIKTILIDPGIRKKTTYLDVYSRHGRSSYAVSFRINFLIGKIGGGYSQDKGHSINNNNKRPVDCKDGAANLSGSNLVSSGRPSTSDGGWHKWGNCNRTCDGGKQVRYGTKTITQPRKYTKVGPKHGGRNNCADTSGPNHVTTESIKEERNCNTHACCSYKGCGWCSVGPSVGSRKWVAHVHDCYEYCKGRWNCKYFQIVGGVYCYTYQPGSSSGAMNSTGRQMVGRGWAGGQCHNS